MPRNSGLPPVIAAAKAIPTAREAAQQAGRGITPIPNSHAATPQPHIPKAHSPLERKTARNGAREPTKRTKTYGLTLKATPANTQPQSVCISAHNPYRTMLMVQNTGAGDLLMRFDSPVLGDGTDILFSVGSQSGILWDRWDTCPESAIYIASIAGTTISITEQIVR